MQGKDTSTIGRPEPPVGDPGAAREASDEITTADGAVRQLEKADRNDGQPEGTAGQRHAPDPAVDPDGGTVRSLEKAGEGAPEEEHADAGGPVEAGPGGGVPG
jgi:hypothetical protein